MTGRKRSLAQEYSPARAAHSAIRALLVAMVMAFTIAACGANEPPPSLTMRDSPAPASSETPAPVSITPSSTPGNASSAPVPSSAEVSLEACALLTGAELSKILGVEGVQPRPMPSGGWVAGQCAWNGPASGFFVSAGTAESLRAFGDPAAPNAKAKLAEFKEQAGATSKDVPGIGDGAVLAGTGLGAYKGDAYLQFTNLGLTEDQLIEIAKLAVTRL